MLWTPVKRLVFLMFTVVEKCRIMERKLEFTNGKSRILRSENVSECTQNATFCSVNRSFSKRVNATFFAVILCSCSLRCHATLPKVYRVSVAWHLKMAWKETTDQAVWKNKQKWAKSVFIHRHLRKTENMRYPVPWKKTVWKVCVQWKFNATLNCWMKSIPWYIWIFLWNSLFVGF